MIIRPETQNEFPELFCLIETAFKTAEVSDGTEQEFTDRLRESGSYIPALALVAETRGRLIGQVMFTRLEITGRTRDGATLLLPPVSVVKEYRGRGVGSALIREGVRRATDLGYDAVILIGNPLYYRRFGLY